MNWTHFSIVSTGDPLDLLEMGVEDWPVGREHHSSELGVHKLPPPEMHEVRAPEPLVLFV